LRFNNTIFYVLTIIIITGCGILDKKSDQDEGEWYEGFAYIETGDENRPFIIAHQNEEHVLPTLENGRLSILQYWKGNDTENVSTMYLNHDELPELVIVEGHTILFENYDFENNTVDIGIITPDGNTFVEEKIPLDFNIQPKMFSSIDEYHKFVSGDLVRGVNLGLSIGSCAIGIATIKFGIGLALLPSCGSAFLSTMALISDNGNWGKASTTWSTSFCVGNPLDPCVGTALTILAAGLDQAEEQKQRESERIAGLTGEMRFGGVWKRNDIQNAWLIVKSDEIVEPFYFSSMSCYEIFTAKFVKVDGDVFTYENESGAQVDIKYELISSETLRATRLNDGFSATLGRSSLNPADFVPLCNLKMIEPERNSGNIIPRYSVPF